MKKFFFKNLKPIIGFIISIILLSTIATFIMTLKPIVLAGLMNNALSEIGYDLGNENDEQDELKKVEDTLSFTNYFDLNNVSKLANSVIGLLNFEDFSTLQIILVFVILLVLVSVLGSIVKFLADILNNYTRNQVLQRVRSEITEKLLTFGLLFFNKRKVGDVSSRVIEDSKAFAQGVVSVPHRVFEQGLLIIIYSTYLFMTSYTLALNILIILGAHYILSQFIKKPLKATQQKTYDKTADLSANLQETFSSVRIIKSFARESFVLKQIGRKIIESSKSFFKAQNIISLQHSSRQILDAFAEGMIIVIAMYQLFNSMITLEGFILFIYVSRLLMPPISEISTQLVWISGIRASFNRIGEYLFLNPNVSSGNINKDLFQSQLSLKSVNFSYEKDKVLKDISITIDKSEVVAIVGPSGSGKSTILDLILRMYDPNSGIISIDGEDIRNLSLNKYRNIFGVVPQEPFLFNDSIMNNIKFGRDYISDKDVYNAAKVANAHSFIDSTSNKYETILGDRGVRLSGGQKQRISIARAIAGNPQILLFDEATSALDTDSEKQVQDAIENVLVNSTAIVVAHRLSTIIKANKIVVLAQGRVESVGSHQYLLDNSITYKRLSKLQEIS